MTKTAVDKIALQRKIDRNLEWVYRVIVDDKEDVRETLNLLRSTLTTLIQEAREEDRIVLCDKFEVVEKNCVNSNWTARFLARDDQECCQCSFGECKVRVAVANNGHNPYIYILTEKELKSLTPKDPDKPKV